MAVELLEKGQNVSLAEKIEAGLTKVEFGLAWDESQDGKTFDADAAAIMLDESGKVVQDGILYYGTTKTDGKLQLFGGAAIHSGDNLTGDADGDDEVITVDLPLIPANVAKVVLLTNIYQAVEKGQNFGQNSEYAVNIYNGDTHEKMFSADLKEDNSTDIAMIVGELYRHNGSWKFKAIEKGTKDSSLTSLINNNF